MLIVCLFVALVEGFLYLLAHKVYFTFSPHTLQIDFIYVLSAVAT